MRTASERLPKGNRYSQLASEVSARAVVVGDCDRLSPSRDRLSLPLRCPKSRRRPSRCRSQSRLSGRQATNCARGCRAASRRNPPASTKVGDTLEFELPASILTEDADEPGEEAAEEAPPPAAAPAAAEPPPPSSQKRQGAAASSRLSAFGLGNSSRSSGGRKTRVVSVAGALRNDVVKDEKFTSTRI